MIEDGEKDEINDLGNIEDLVRQNNRILRKMVRGSRYRQLFSFLYFLVIVGGMLFAYYYIQPYIEDMMGLYEMISNYDLNSAEPFSNAYQTFEQVQEKANGK